MALHQQQLMQRTYLHTLLLVSYHGSFVSSTFATTEDQIYLAQSACIVPSSTQDVDLRVQYRDQMSGLVLVVVINKWAINQSILIYHKTQINWQQKVKDDIKYNKEGISIVFVLILGAIITKIVSQQR